MKGILLILILTFSFQSWTKADDISDFEIEGMSTGDSLLDYFSKSEIKKNKKNYYNNDEIIPVYFENRSEFKSYSGVQLHYRNTDKSYKIIAISGIILFKNNINNCKKKQNEVFYEIKDMFPNGSIDKFRTAHAQDKSGKSYIISRTIRLDSGDNISVDCYDWTKKMGYDDHLRISIITKNFLYWINNKAYK